MKDELLKQLELVQRAHQLLEISEDDIQLGEDEDCIEAGGWVLTPINATRKVNRIGGEREIPCIKWQLTAFTEIPGRWNPHDGGTPPDVDEKDCGEFDNLTAALLSIVEYNAKLTLDSIGEAIALEQMEAAEEIWDDYERDVQERHARCPHHCEFHECNACMIAGDLAFDAAREM
jgi:hypothetical protein